LRALLVAALCTQAPAADAATDNHFVTHARDIFSVLAGSWSITWFDLKNHIIGRGVESWQIAPGETAFVEENRSKINGHVSDEYAAMWWDPKAAKVHGIWCDDSINDEGCSGFDVTLHEGDVVLDGVWEFHGKPQAWREVFHLADGRITQKLYIGDPGGELMLAGVIRGRRQGK
jgi:hypothetical protein